MDMAGSLALVAVSLPFAIGGLAALWDPRLVRRLRAQICLRREVCRLLGLMALLAAAFLVVPNTRIWGAVLAGGMSLGIASRLVYYHRYLWSVPVLLLLAVLLPAAFVS